MIPSSRPKLADLYTLSQSKLHENHTLHSSTYLYSPHMVVPLPPRGVRRLPGTNLKVAMLTNQSYLTVQSKVEQHKKEEERPERRCRHLLDSLWVSNER